VAPTGSSPAVASAAATAVTCLNGIVLFICFPLTDGEVLVTSEHGR
jgi:hypothetical protein